MLSPGSCLRNEAVDYKQQNVWQQGEMRVEEEKDSEKQELRHSDYRGTKGQPQVFQLPSDYH